MKNITGLQHIHTLNLKNCKGIQDFSSLAHGTIYTLNLSETNITDVSFLGYVHTLKLNCCMNLENVSALGTVYDLDLSVCIKVSNISKLGKIHKLDLSGCKKIRDVSVLGSVHTLNLSCCENLINTDALIGVKILDLSWCNKYPYDLEQKRKKLGLKTINKILP